MMDALRWTSAAVWVLLFLQFLVIRVVMRPLPKTGPGEPEKLPLVSVVSPRVQNHLEVIRKLITSE